MHSTEKQDMQAAAMPQILLPQAPILLAQGRRAMWLSPDGVLEEISASDAAMRIANEMPITCYAPSVARHLGLENFQAYDVLELFAFVHPGKFCAPTVKGLAKALDVFVPDIAANPCAVLLTVMRHLLIDLQNQMQIDKNAAAIAYMMGLCQTPLEEHTAPAWPWAATVLQALGKPNGPERQSALRRALQIWLDLPEWAEHAPEPPAGHHNVTGDEAEKQLAQFLAHHDPKNREERPQQKYYTTEVTDAFAAVGAVEQPHLVLAEAGTGTGKTLGYLAPSTVWAEKNEGAVWVSTYTRNLQRQIFDEMGHLYTNEEDFQRKTVIRKGRENYLCLLNLEDAVQSPSLKHHGLNATAIGLMVRWAMKTQDGDLVGGDFPGWLSHILGWGRTIGLSDRRGECIYAGCDHFNKCFVEKSIRKSKRARIVIANHALVMMQTALAGEGDQLPNRYVFDEAHHLFDAADSAFSIGLSGTEAADLRRWLVGAEKNTRSRARGLKKRLEGLVEDNQDALDAIEDVMEMAKSLPASNWRQRLYDEKPQGLCEAFLALVRQQVYARAHDADVFYSLECETQPLVDGVFDSAYALSLRLQDLKRPMDKICKILRKKLEDETEDLDTETRNRIDSLCRSIQRRSEMTLAGWLKMLDNLTHAKPAEFVDWFAIERVDGRDFDIGMYRHWVDPMEPFAHVLRPYAHGVLMTSASLTDQEAYKDEEGNVFVKEDAPEKWEMAEQRTGMPFFTDLAMMPPKKLSIPSPFKYAENSRILVVTDVNKNDARQVSAAYQALFMASGGGALGLFTAISRLRQIYDQIIDPMTDAQMPLYAQHMDQVDVTTLVEMFRQETDACLLGTDATRDGMDVPGDSLRLIVYDRTPWPRPTILHKARRNAFGRAYDDMMTRYKLKQAYGRLIRKADDQGVFIMMDSMLPSRLLSAFPSDVTVERVGLAEAIEITKQMRQAQKERRK